MTAKIIKEVRWCDTRDMTADGHTKGSIDRELLLKLMEGFQKFAHPVKTFKPNEKRNPTGSATTPNPTGDCTDHDEEDEYLIVEKPSYTDESDET